MNFNQLLREFRRQNRLTQGELGDLLGISGKYISRLEHTSEPPGIAVRKRLIYLLTDTNFQFSFKNIDVATSYEIVMCMLNEVADDKRMYIIESFFNTIRLLAIKSQK